MPQKAYDKYQVNRQLWQGGMAAVYRAYDPLHVLLQSWFGDLDAARTTYESWLALTCDLSRAGPLQRVKDLATRLPVPTETP